MSAMKEDLAANRITLRNMIRYRNIDREGEVKGLEE